MEHVDQLEQAVSRIIRWVAELEENDVWFLALLALLVGVGAYLRKISRKQ